MFPTERFYSKLLVSDTQQAVCARGRDDSGNQYHLLLTSLLCGFLIADQSAMVPSFFDETTGLPHPSRKAEDV